MWREKEEDEEEAKAKGTMGRKTPTTTATATATTGADDKWAGREFEGFQSDGPKPGAVIPQAKLI